VSLIGINSLVILREKVIDLCMYHSNQSSSCWGALYVRVPNACEWNQCVVVYDLI
jgi:hypothetical protein